jgi:hypothetical protein
VISNQTALLDAQTTPGGGVIGFGSGWMRRATRRGKEVMV